jgi:hypothetical protein
MLLFEITLRGNVIKRIEAPSQKHLESFLKKHDLECHVINTKILFNDDSDRDVILGKSVEILYGDRGMGCAYIDWWSQESCCKSLDKGGHPINNHYQGQVVDRNEIVTRNGELFDSKPSLTVHNGSPDGFAWGYMGSGPHQLALAILLSDTGNPKLALANAHRLCQDVISRYPKDGSFDLWSIEVKTWLDGLQQPQKPLK